MTRFWKIVRSARSSQEVLDKIRQEPQEAQQRLLHYHELWRKGVITERSGAERVIGPILGRIICFAIPLLIFYIRVREAIREGYAHTRLLADPGHRLIRWVDSAVVAASFFIGACIVLTDRALLSPSSFFSFETLALFIFPQFSGLKSFIVINGFVAVLTLYDVQRNKIIRSINERHGTW